MKKSKYFLNLLLAVLMTTGASITLSGQTLTQISVTPPAGPYASGSIITIRYDLTFPMTIGNTAAIQVTYNNNVLDFDAANSNLIINNSLFTGYTNSGGILTFTTSPFTMNATSSSSFDLSFKVIAGSCQQITTEIKSVAILYNNGGSQIGQSIVPPLNLSILNPAATPSLNIRLVEGSACGKALYEIRSYGKDLNSGPGNSTLNLTLPAGAQIVQVSGAYQVYNTSGAIVSAVTATGTGPTTYSWPRSGQPLENTQLHYVLVDFTQGFVCPDVINASLNTYSCVDQSTIVYSDSTASCCPEIPGASSKTLTKTPLRYFPVPDNCKEHEYSIEVVNLTSVNYNLLKVEDKFNDINLLAGNEIQVGRIEVSLERLLPNLPPASFKFTTSYSPLPSGTPPVSFTTGPVTITTTSGPAIIYNVPSTASAYSNTSSFLDLFTLTNALPSGLPPFSKLIIKVKHRLHNLPLPFSTPRTHEYENTAKVTYSHPNGPVQVEEVVAKSNRDQYAPHVTLQKLVRNPALTGVWNDVAVTAAPNDITEFKIIIKNYGMAVASSVQFTDNAVTGNPNYFTIDANSVQFYFSDPNAYSPGVLTSIKNGIKAVLTGSQTSYMIPFLPKAPCDSFYLITVSYKVKIAPENIVTCPSNYVNTASLTIPNHPLLSDAAAINIDLFKGIIYSLEATCDKTKPWSMNQINGVPNYPVHYRATVFNSNTYALTNVKVMVQLPNGINPSQITITDHPSPLPQATLTSSNPGTPSGTGLFPILPLQAGVSIGKAISNWLNSPIAFPAGNEALYAIVPSIAPNSSYTLEYTVTVPINTPGSVYKTAMGISFGYNTSCPIVKAAPPLDLVIATSDNCRSIENCDLILFDKSVKNMGNNVFRVTLGNILDMHPGYDIDKIEIIVHQPYKNCMISGPPYIKPVLPFTLGVITTAYTAFALTQPTPGQRFYSITNNSTPVTFGNVAFDINISNPPANPCGIVFPINILFKDTTQNCTFCEKTIFLSPDDWSLLIQDPLFKSQDDPVNVELNLAREEFSGTPLGKQIELWYAEFKSRDGINKILVNHFDEAVSLMQVARKLIQSGGTLEKSDVTLLEKNMRLVDRNIAPAPPGLIDECLKRLNASIGKPWQVVKENLKR